MTDPEHSPATAARATSQALPCAPVSSAAQLAPGWRRWYQRALPAYWIFLYGVTHFPKLSLRGPIEHPDLYSHFLAFALLAFLAWRFMETLRPIGRRFVWIVGTILFAYAAFDEWSQQFVGRSPTLFDLLADMGGVATALAALEFARRRRAAGASSSALPSAALPAAQPTSRSPSP